MAANRIYIQVDFQHQNAVAGVNQLNNAIAAVGPTTQKATAQASQGISSMSMTIKQSRQAMSDMQGMLAGLGLARLNQEFIESAKNLDSWQKTLKSSLGTGEQFAQMYERLRLLSLKPGLSLESTITGFARLKPAVKDSELVIKFIDEMGNALARMGKGGEVMTRVSVQFGQMASRGKISMEDLRLITAEVPQVNDALLKLWGTMDPEELTKKGVTMRVFFEGLISELAKTERAIPGVVDQLDNFRDQVTQTTGSVGKDVLTNLKPAFDSVSKSLTSIANAWNSMPADLKKITSLIIGVGIAGMTTLLAMLVSPTLGLAIAGISASIVILADTFGKLANSIATAKQAWSDLMAGKFGLFSKDAAARLAEAASGTAPPETLSPKDMEEWRKKRVALGLPPMHSPEVYKERKDLADKAAKEAANEAAKKAAKDAAQAAIDLKKWAESVRQQTSKALQDAIGDRQKGMAELLPPSQKLAAQVEAMMTQRAKEWKDLTTRTGPGGETQTLKTDAATREAFAKETAIRIGIIQDKWRQEQIAEQKKYLGTVAEMTVENLKATTDEMTRIWQEHREREFEAQQAYEEAFNSRRIEAIENQRDRQLAELEGLADQTLQQQLDISQKRLAIEQEYIDKALQEQLRLLDIDYKRLETALAYKAVIDGTYGSPEFNKMIQAEADLYRLKREALQGGAAEQKEINRAKTVADQNKMIRTEIQKTYDYFQRMAEGVFDALLDKSKSVWQAMADFWKQAWLTAMKAVFSHIIASGLTRLFGGVLPGGGAGGGGSRSGGGWGNLGGIFSGGGGGNRGGFTGLPIPGWGGWGGGTFPGGTPPIIGNGGTTGGSGGYGSYGAGLAGYGKSGVGLLRSLGGIGRGPVDVLGNPLGSVPGTASAVGTGVGGVAGGAMLLGGAALAGYGLYKGGWKGVGMATAGGAMIGAKIGAFAGPMGIVAGAAIGAAIGFTAGMIRKMFKSASEKTRQKIKEVYGVDITSQGILAQITQIIKQSYGGDINVGVYSPEVQEMVKLYAMTQGTSASGMGRPMTPVSWAMSGGSASIQPVYNGGQVVSNPYTGPTTLDLAYSRAPLFVTLNPEQANQLFEGRVVQVIGDNPNPVGDAAAASASGASARRSHQQSAILEPMTVLS